MFTGKAVLRIICNPLIQLVLMIILASAYHSSLSLDAIRFFLTISVCLRELLVFVLPFLLFSFVAVALSSIPREGMFFIFGLMLVVVISNFLNILISGAVGFFILSDVMVHAIPAEQSILSPFFAFHLPQIAGTSHSLLLGIVVGLLNSFYPNQDATLVIGFIHGFVLKFMKKFFVPLLPLFVGGFLLKLFSEGRMAGFIEQNAGACLKMCGFLWCYLALWLLVTATFHMDRAIEVFKNIFPAIVTAFSTMSSAAALPLSIEAAEKNTKDRVLANAVMPITLNFHMVGDTIVVPIIAMMVLLAFNHPLPRLSEFIMFGIFFVLNKFAGGGVPSGTIMVTLPVLKDHFGFDDSMLAFIIAFYGIMDPVATCGNVFANNLFVILFQKIRKFVKMRIIGKEEQ
jgi:Na+/H+-dicarboxylate symporter